MASGFATTTPFNLSSLAYAATYQEGQKVASVSSGTRYTLVVSSAETEAVMATITAVNDKPLAPVSRRSVRLSDRGGHVYVEPAA